MPSALQAQPHIARPEQIRRINRRIEEAIVMRKSAQLSVRITEQEMANLRDLATRESLLLSQLIRGILTANSKQTGVAALFRRFTTSRPMATPGPEYPGV